MDNNLQIKVTATLDPASSTQILQSQLNEIAKGLKLTVGIDPNQLKNFQNTINQIQEKLKGTTKPIPLIDPEQEAKLKNSLTTIDQAIAKVKDLGTVKVSNDQINPLTGAVEKFTLTVTKGKDEVEKFKYELASLKGLVIGGQENQLFVPTKNSSVKNTDANILKQIQQDQQNELKLGQQLIDQQEKFTQALKKTYDQGLLTDEVFKQFSTSINGAKDIEQLNLVQKAIQSTIQAEKNLIQQQELISKANILLNSGKISDTSGLQTLISDLAKTKINPEASDATRQLSLMRSELTNITTSARTAGEQATTFGEAIKKAFSSLSIYFGGAALLFQSFNFLKDGVSYINEMNKSLTTISMITHESQDQVAGLANQFQQLGNDLSVSTTEIAKSATELYRQGLSIDEVNSRLKIITEFSRVAGLSAEDATNYITAATNSMQVSAQKAADTFAILGHSSGVNAGYIAASFQRVGGTAGALGLDFQKVASYIATIGERTKESAETIGQSVKSIIARFQNLKEKGYDSSDNTTVNNVAKALNSVNIQLLDSSGNFRDFTKVLDELGGKWDGLNNRTRSYLATAIAGTYQQSRFFDLMQGHARSMELYQKALDSAGATQDKFNAYLQGSEAAFQKFTNNVQGLWSSIFNSKEINVTLNSLDGLVSGVKNIINTFGALPTIASVAGVAILAFNGGLKSIMANGALTIATLKGIGTGFTDVASKEAVASLGANLYNASSKALTLTFNGLKTAFISTSTFLAGAIFPIAAISAVTFAIEKLTQAYVDYKQKQADIKKSQDDLVKSYSSSSDQVDKLASNYEKLSDKVKNGQINSSNQEYVDTMNKLGQLMPNLVQSEDEHGNKILRSVDAVKEELDYAKKLKSQYDQMNIDNFNKDVLDQANKLNDILSQIDKLNRNATGADQSPIIQAKGIVTVDQSTKDYDYTQILAQEHEYQLLLQQSSSLMKEKATAILDVNKVSKDLSKSQEKIISDYLDESSASAKNIKNGDDFKKFITETTEKAVTLGNELAPLQNKITDVFSGKDILSFSKAQTSVLKDVSTNIKNGYTDWDTYKVKLTEAGFSSEQVDKLLQSLEKTTSDVSYSTDDLSKRLANAKGNFDEISNVITDMIKAQEYDMAVTASQKEAYSTLSDTLSPVNKMLEDMANGQTLSASAAMDLIQKVPEMTKYLSIQNGQVQVNIQGVLDWRNAQIASFQDMINAEKAQVDAQSKDLKTKLANYGVEIQAILSVAQANDALAEAEKKHAENAAKIDASNAPGAMHASMVEQGQYDEVASGINQIKDAYSQLDQLSSMASTGLTQVGTSMDKTSKSTQQSTYVTDQYKQAMDQLNNAMQKVQSLQQKYPQYSQQYRDALQQEINLLKQQKDLTDAQAANLQKQIDSGIIQQTGMITNSNSNGSVASSGGSSSSNYNYASGGSTQAQIWNFLKGKGLSDSAISGIMGNLQVESGFSTSAYNNSSGATGLAQWLGSRLSNLKSQPNWNSLDTQLNFLWSEWASMMPNNFNSLSASQAATSFESIFERSGGSLNSKRISYANSILSQFAGSGGTYSGGTSSGGSGSSTAKSAVNMAQDIDQAKSQVLQLQQQSQQYADAMQADYLKIIQAGAAMFDHIKQQYDSQISQYDYLQSVENKNGADWLHTQMNREAAIQQQIKAEQDSINYLQQQIQYNNQLTEAQKATLSDDVLNRQKELLSIEQKLFDTRNQMATEIVDTYKQALTDMKDASTKAIDNEINAINKAADSASYKKKLSDAQQSAQDIQNQITQLMLDDSTSAKKKISDLQKQLTTQNDSISQMVSDNNKQQQIDNLNTQKQTVSDYYDNMLNDTRKFTQMQSDILNLNNQGIINDLSSFSTTIQKNVNILGTSVVNTIIDMVNRANGYMSLSTANSSVIGHVASLDSGGLLSGWGSQGKLAMLHEKEIVLNKNDTSNFLKAINFTRDFFSNIKLPDLSGFKMNPAVAGGNNYYVNFNVDKMSGNQNDVNSFVSKFVNGIKSKGGNI